jgi:putative tryptophan/tyrosine transport system substrate-binding protein
MRRREVITLLGSAAAWPIAARAQQPTMPVVGFLRSTSRSPFENLVNAFEIGLSEAGFTGGQNVTIAYRYADDQFERLQLMIAELIQQPVTVIVANNASALVALSKTMTVPIVFVTGGDPVSDGLVANLNRPGGNVTGVVFFSSFLGPKRFELLRELVPQAITIAVLTQPGLPNTEAEFKAVEQAAEAIGQRLAVVKVNNDRDIDGAFDIVKQRGAGALFVGAGPLLNSRRDRLVWLAARHQLPASFGNREAVTGGGLMSYAASQSHAYRQAGAYAARILKGEKPGELPVIRSDKLEFVINLKTAKTLGLSVPLTLQAAADEVIE